MILDQNSIHSSTTGHQCTPIISLLLGLLCPVNHLHEKWLVMLTRWLWEMTRTTVVAFPFDPTY